MKKENNQLNSAETEIIIKELKNIIVGGAVGDVVEFGCYDGGTSVHLAKILKNTNKKLYVYDSFEGLPEKSVQDSSPVGEQFKAGELNVSKKQFIKNMQKAGVDMPVIKKGWFCDLSNQDVPDKICFAFLDGDYYESIRDSFRLIENKLTPKAVIIVDDYTNDALPGARRAVDEWLAGRNLKLHVNQSLAIIYC